MIAVKGVASLGAAVPVGGETLADGRRKAVKFNGINQRGVLSSRAIDPDADIDISFSTGPSVPVAPAVSYGIVGQNISNVRANWEVLLRVADPAGVWQLIVGGVNAFSSGEPIEPNRRYRVRLVGSLLTYYKDGAIVASGSYTRGGAREPLALTNIACRGSGVGTFLGFYPGELYDISINGTLWPMDDETTPTQVPTPSGNNMTLVAVTPDAWRPI